MDNFEMKYILNDVLTVECSRVAQDHFDTVSFNW